MERKATQIELAKLEQVQASKLQAVRVKFNEDLQSIKLELVN